MDPYVGEIRAVAFNFAPVGWMLCQGQLLPVNQYAALFSLLGTTYGGNGTTNFALPNLQGRIAVGSGTGTGLSQCTPGEQAGVASVTLLTGNLAAHIHSIPVSPAAAAGSAAPGPQTLLGGAVAAHHTGGTSYYVTPTVQAGAVAQMANVVQPAGSNMPHNNMAPFLAMQYVIALQGIFPAAALMVRVRRTSRSHPERLVCLVLTSVPHGGTNCLFNAPRVVAYGHSCHAGGCFGCTFCRVAHVFSKPVV